MADNRKDHLKKIPDDLPDEISLFQGDQDKRDNGSNSEFNSWPGPKDSETMYPW